MLEVAGLEVSYGQHLALAGVSVRISPGEIVAVLGANGAGKSTLLQAIAGLITPSGGSITMESADLLALAAHQIVEAGIALVPEGRGVFAELTVHENLTLGANAKRARAAEQENRQFVLTLFPRLHERLQQTVRTMSGGEQQMVAIGRALMSAPEILLLDEPSLGLSPLLSQELFAVLERVRRNGTGVMLVEQNAHQSLRIADRAYLIETGRLVGQGAAAQLAEDPKVQRAYLGAAETRLPQ